VTAAPPSGGRTAPAPPDDRPVVTVVGLGPAGADLVTAGTLDAIAGHDHRFLRTSRHPAASLLAGAPTFDAVYERSERLGDVYPAIVDALVAAAGAHGAVLYAVPGSPLVAERTVELLRADDRVRLVMQPALSFLDLAWARLGIDPVAAGVRVVDGHRFEVEAAGERGPLLVGQCDSGRVLSDIKLAIADALETRSTVAPSRTVDGPAVVAAPDDLMVTVLQRLGLPDEAVVTLRWDELDRAVVPDHLTSLWIPAYAAPVAREVQRFVELVATLRRECPWDREQTHESLMRHLLEESYEVLDALDHVDPEAGAGYDHLEEELGDLLFQVVFHAVLAAEAGQFTLADVARHVHDKLWFRHPHVFGDVSAGDPDQVAANWEDLKRREKGRPSVFDGIPEALPALLLALKVQKKAAALERGSTVGEGRAGVRPPAAPPDLDAARAGVARDPGVASLGELLYAVVDLAVRLDLDPETALRSAALARRDAWRAVEKAR
jgi:tetrapyrrole methylase family protein/MazG family protein